MITDQRHRTLSRPLVLVVLILGLILTGLFLSRDRAPTLPGGSFSIQSVPQGVSLRTLSGTPVFIVRMEATVTVFLTNPQHLPGEDGLWWCPGESLFASPTHGELFDIEGRVVGGPARRDLTRLETTIEDGMLTVHGNRPIYGERPTSSQPQEAPLGEEWDSGPGSFCRNSVRSHTL
jgi:nitrite reductase/ring-hydroxylating ferredoxin subunit